MTKNLIFIISITFCISCSNNDDSSNSEAGNSGLLKKTIKHFNYSNLSDEIFEYFYEDGNRLKRIESSRGSKLIFTYSNDLIIKTEWFGAGNDFSSKEFNFEYNSNNQLIKFVKSPSIQDNYVYTHLDNGNIKYDQYYSPNPSPANYKRTVELIMENGNLINEDVYFFTYDNNMKSPYYGIKGLDKTYFVDQLMEFDNYPSYFNNLTNWIHQGVSNTNYSYEYNTDNKPILMTSNVPAGNNSTEYFYY